MKTEDILNEREKTHGDFGDFAELWAELNRAIREHTEKQDRPFPVIYPPRTRVHTTAICMILNKIARIICGDPNFADHWDDIAGYAMLGKGKEPAVILYDAWCVKKYRECKCLECKPIKE
jgi:hypothetical protein